MSHQDPTKPRLLLPQGHGPDPSFGLRRGAREELADILELKPRSRRGQKMIREVECVLSEYPSAARGMDHAPRPGDMLRSLEYFAQLVEQLLLRLQASEAWWWDVGLAGFRVADNSAKTDRDALIELLDRLRLERSGR